jgi:hypothetical protein
MQNQNDDCRDAQNERNGIESPNGKGCSSEPKGQVSPVQDVWNDAMDFPEVEPWPETVDGALLLNELEQVMRTFVVLPKWAAETLALWTVHTYAYHLGQVSTYLGIESPVRRCGKTTLLGVISQLAHRSMASANISSPAVFRAIDETRPTLLIDETDMFLNKNDELKGILNAGYTKQTAFVVRVSNQKCQSEEDKLNKGGKENLLSPALSSAGGGERVRRGGSRLARFSCWCPKVIATIGRLPETFADRCILIRMQRKTADERCERLRDFQGGELRRKCVRFVIDHAESIRIARPQIPASLNDRAADIWEPLLALADLAGGSWPTKARNSAEGLMAGAQESSPIGALLMDILTIFASGETGRVYSRDLAAKLNEFENRPWGEIRNGKPITELWLAQQLRPYGVRPKVMRIGEAVGKGYEQQDFGDVFRRYIPRSELDALKSGA